VINHKRTERIYREEGLALRKKRRRKGAAGVRVVMTSPQRTNEKWSMDFVTDSIVTGRRFRALDEWAYRKGVKLNFIRPGKPIENALAESFIGRLRDECLNTNWFMNLKHARDIIEDWRRDYNEVRPHSSLKGSTPKEYAEITAGL
jgi:putative transposase